MVRAESSIEKAVVKWAKREGIPVFKLKLDANAGWPDRMFLLPGPRPCFIEFKRADEEPTKLQYHRINTLRELGYDAIWTRNETAAIRWLATIRAEALQTPSLSEAGHPADDKSSLRGAAP